MAAHDFYVYVLFDELGLPRYVGKGRSSRWHSHERYFRTDISNPRKRAFIKRTLAAIGEIPKVKIQYNLTEDKAFEFEAALIEALGRLPEGLLTNITAGGFCGLTQEAVRKGGFAAAASMTKEARKARSRKAVAGLSKAQRAVNGRKAAITIRNKGTHAWWTKGLRWVTDGTQRRRIRADQTLPPTWYYGFPHQKGKNRLDPTYVWTTAAEAKRVETFHNKTRCCGVSLEANVEPTTRSAVHAFLLQQVDDSVLFHSSRFRLALTTFGHTHRDGAAVVTRNLSIDVRRGRPAQALRQTCS